jgi:hypothetical protein
VVHPILSAEQRNKEEEEEEEEYEKSAAAALHRRPAEPANIFLPPAGRRRRVKQQNAEQPEIKSWVAVTGRGELVLGPRELVSRAGGGPPTNL